MTRSDRAAGLSGLGRWVLPIDARDRPRPVRNVRRASGARGVRKKGQKAEQELVRVLRSVGFEKAYKTPASGGWRPHGAGDLPEMPGDVGGCLPFAPIEAKHDADATVPARGTGYVGGAFLRATLRDLAALWRRLDAVVGGSRTIPVGAFRMPLEPGRPLPTAWRFLVPERAGIALLLGGPVGDFDVESWIEIDGPTFLAEAPHLLDNC